MASTRRIGQEQSQTRSLLLDAAEQVLREEGYAAVTSRRVAARAELKPQLVHYYFRTMDDLFLAMFRRRTEEALTRYAEALATDRPLRALWEISRDPEGTAFISEFTALANHRKPISAEIASYGERLREIQVEAIGRHLAARGMDAAAYPPAAISILIAGVSLFLRMENGIGLENGHAEMETVMERWLSQMDAGASPAALLPAR